MDKLRFSGRKNEDNKVPFIFPELDGWLERQIRNEEKNRERERDRQRDRQTDRHTDRHRQRETDRQKIQKSAFHFRRIGRLVKSYINSEFICF
jgi:hypothetical protein